MMVKTQSSPRILQWYSGGLGVVWDEGLSLHSRHELMDWVQHGQQFIVLDYETGEDVTRVFFAHRIDGASPLIDPMEQATRAHCFFRNPSRLRRIARSKLVGPMRRKYAPFGPHDPAADDPRPV